jgi:hypothetical protein
MNQYAVFAFVVTPAIVLLVGWCAVLLHERALKRERSREG